MNEKFNNLVDVNQIAKLLNVAPSWIYKKTRTNQIPFIKLGKYCRFDAQEVMEWAKIKANPSE